MNEFEFAHYGEERDIDATEGEWLMYEGIIKLISDCGGDLSIPRLTRVSSGYVTVKYGDWDVARVKYTDRAKWVIFPYTSNEKNRISSPEEVSQFGEFVQAFLDGYNKFN